MVLIEFQWVFCTDIFTFSKTERLQQRKKQLDWLATNTDDIISQSHSLFACSREQIRQVENRLKMTYQVCNSRLCVDQSRMGESHLGGHACTWLPVLADFDKCARF